MRTTQPDVFALQNAGAETFLYAEIGTELNGSTLTILSMLARLGRDPWAEAARWAALPRAGAIESLARDIDRMPLVPAALATAGATAARLVQLLPAASPGARLKGLGKTERSALPTWLPATLLYCAMALAMAMAVTGFLAPKPSQAVVATAEQPMGAPVAPAGPVERAVGPPFFAFRIMVAAGLLMLALVVTGTVLRRDDRFMRSAWFLRACQWAAPLGFVAVIAGWVTTEVGRQPWTVYGLLRTANSVSPSLTGRDVMMSLIAYIVVYAIVFPGGFFVLRRILREGAAP